MERECHAFVAACHHCGGLRSQPVIGAAAGFAPTPSAPFEVVHLDHKGPLSMSNGYTFVLVAVCALTRFTLFIPVRDAKMKTTWDALISHVFSVFGFPLVLVSDNGRAFANKLLKASEELFGFRQIFVMPHTPQANGLAEAAVKKLKIMLDRHTLEYDGWHRLLPIFQIAVNHRATSGHHERPFTALFAREPVTLAALEQPELLPAVTSEQRDVRAVASLMARLHQRLRQESDDIKRVAMTASREAAPERPVRPVLKGDKVWLLYSDGARSRYIRKHGHGKPWRHPFTVLDVKPHAVLLEVPSDGSVPEVLPWQSLRKCSFSAPHFHDDEMPLPAVDDNGFMRTACPGAPQESAELPAPAALTGDGDGWATWTSDTRYEIERIVSATRVGSGWRLVVKWKGYPDSTPERLQSILRQVHGHPDILAQIEQCKADYLSQHPTVRDVLEQQGETDDPATLGDSTPDVQPTRQQPHRERQPPTHFMFSVYGARDPISTSVQLMQVMTSLRLATKRRIAAIKAFANDRFW